MSNYQIIPEAIFGGCNPVFSGCDLYKTTLAYVCDRQIYIYDILTKKVLVSLVGHAKRAQCVKIINENTIISVGSDGYLIYWQCDGDQFYHQSWKEIYKLKISESVLLRCNYFEESKLLSVSSSDGNVYLVELNESPQIIDFLCFGKKVQEITSICRLDGNNYILCVGGLDHKIHVYHFNTDSYKHFKNNNLEQYDSKLKFLCSLKGHEDSINDIKIQSLLNEENKLYFLIASTSRDTYIRLWKLFQIDQNIDQTKETFEDKNSYQLNISQEYKFVINLESILIAHSDSVTSLQWGLIDYSKPSNKESNLCLLSSSFDFSLLMSVKDKTGIWVNSTRFGQMNGQKNAFYMSQMNNQYLVAYTYSGSFYLWLKGPNNEYVQQSIISGHQMQVKDLDWSSEYDYLVSCSQDQTTRIFCYWNDNKSWHEVSRSQVIQLSNAKVHGYDINSIKSLKIQNTTQHADILVCGADEKIVRLFEPPAIFANYINHMSKKDLRLYFPDAEYEQQMLVKNTSGIREYITKTQGGAQVLGLMIKAVKVEKEKFGDYYDPEEQEIIEDQKMDDLNDVQINKYDSPPTEDILLRNTLWPEMNKLYGHGYEIQTVLSNNKGTLIVSTCKSQSLKHSSILLWDPVKCRIIDKLTEHSLTVTQLCFSNNDEFLCSVSRDRQISLFKKQDDNEHPYKLFYVDKTHSRIVWSVSFTHDNQYFMTGARDRKIKMFQISENSVDLVLEKTFKNPVTAVAFAPKQLNSNYYALIGFENGQIMLAQINLTNNQRSIEIISQIEKNCGHDQNINKIKFMVNNDTHLTFASCSDDHSLRIYKIIM